MDLAIALMLFIFLLIGIQYGSAITILAALAIAILSFRDIAPRFIVAGAIAFLLRSFLPQIEEWGAISIAIFVILLISAGKASKSQDEEEIPPELIPYLIAMMGERK